MAESTSPSIFRAPHRLEYASSINTTLTSPTDISTYHSSFDFISEPRDCDTLVTMNQDADRTHRSVLERNFHQLDINTNANQMKRKPKKLDRTESISLPTTPTEELCSSYEHKYNQLLTLNTKINSDDEQPYFLNSSTDYMTAMPEHDLQQIITDEPILNSTSISQSTNSTLLPNSSETNISITYGIDWSERACPTSHCWFSYKLNDLSSSQP
ncbi:unnamed protein product, partial [Rotaria magnacalcarata]